MPANKRQNANREQSGHVLQGLTILEAKELNEILRDEYGIEPAAAAVIGGKVGLWDGQLVAGNAALEDLPDPESIVIEMSMKRARDAISSARKTREGAQAVIDRVNARLAKAS